MTLLRKTNQGQAQRSEAARYYRVKVTNRVPWPSASQVQVLLLRVEESGPDGEMQPIWSGDLPIQWMHQEIYPPARAIGPFAFCDLCSAVKHKWIQLHPIIVPNNFPIKRRSATTLVLSLQARGTEGESPVARFQIAWDGKWEDGDTEMARHLVVKDVTQKA